MKHEILAEGIEIYCGDCMEVMQTFEDGQFDVVITDPPYGVDYRNNGWDKNIPDWINDARRLAEYTVFTTAIATLW